MSENTEESKHASLRYTFSTESDGK